MNRLNRTRAFALIELILMIFVAAMILFVLAVSIGKGRSRSARIQCVDNLKQLGLAARIFATGNMNLYPGELLVGTNHRPIAIDSARYFSSLSRELSTPKILLCPADKRSTEAPAINVVTSRNLSYFANLAAREASPAGFLYGDSNLQLGTNRLSGTVTISSNAPLSWTAERHFNQGNIAFADGSVQQLNNSMLQRVLLQSAMTSNVLVVP